MKKFITKSLLKQTSKFAIYLVLLLASLLIFKNSTNCNILDFLDNSVIILSKSKSFSFKINL